MRRTLKLANEITITLSLRSYKKMENENEINTAATIIERLAKQDVKVVVGEKENGGGQVK